MVEQKVSVHVIVQGQVQGVGFRDFVSYHAELLGLTRWVKNLGDGNTVELVAEGSRRALEELIRRIREGPPRAIVERIDAQWAEQTGRHRDFTVAL